MLKKVLSSFLERKNKMNKKELIKEIQAIDHLNIFECSYYSWGISSPFLNNKEEWLKVKELRQLRKTLIEIYKNLPLFLTQFKKIDEGYCSWGGGYDVFYNKEYDLKFYERDDNEDRNTLERIKKHIAIENTFNEYYKLDVVRSKIQYKNARLSELNHNLERRKTLAYAGGGGYDKVAHILYSFINKNRLNFNNIDEFLDKIDKGYYTNLNQSIDVNKFNDILKDYLIEGSEMRIFKSEIKGSGEFFKCDFYTSFKFPSI